MKKIYSLIALVALSSVAIAQTVKVTFRVNMQNVAVGPKGLHIAGDLQADAGIGSNWSPGATGNTLTLPTSWYVQDQALLFNYGARNSTRMAPYHRLDVSATWFDKAYKTKTDPTTGKEIQVKKRLRNNLAISVYNVYNRANPFFLYVDNDGDFLNGDFKLTVKQVSLFPIIPSVTWNFEF